MKFIDLDNRNKCFQTQNTDGVLKMSFPGGSCSRWNWRTKFEEEEEKYEKEEKRKWKNGRTKRRRRSGERRRQYQPTQGRIKRVREDDKRRRRIRKSKRSRGEEVKGIWFSFFRCNKTCDKVAGGGEFT